MTDEEKLAAEAKAAEDAEAKTAADAAAATAAAGKQTSAVTFTPEQQIHIDAFIAGRVKRAEIAARKVALEEAETGRKKAAMDETERLKVEKTEAEAATVKAIEAANVRIIAAETKVMALAAGANPERIAQVVRLVDLSEVTIGDDGELDAALIKTAVEAVKKDLPELFGAAGHTQRSGGDFGQGTGGKRVYAQSEFAKLCKDPAYFEEHKEELKAAAAEERIDFTK